MARVLGGGGDNILFYFIFYFVWATNEQSTWGGMGAMVRQMNKRDNGEAKGTLRDDKGDQE
jgi:hypothetical protein